MKACKIDVRGKVQGVFFRAQTLSKAKELKLVGTVENKRDSSVQIIAEGEQENLQCLIDWCQRGPLLAEVAEVEVTEIKPLGVNNFKII